MTTRVSAEVTVVDQTDATGLVWWYYASTSATKPSKPSTTDATATPSGWSKSEPTISSESDLSKYVYSCLQTVWGDGTCTWGDVSTSASFEAAKQSYNKALSANSREQVVYYRSKVSTKPSAPTAWVTATGNVYNDTATVGNAGWTRKVTPVASSTSSSADKYQYLFSCVQRQTVSQSSGTTCTNGDVLLEEYTTVIDGSLLVENSVTATQINASGLKISDMSDADDYETVSDFEATIEGITSRVGTVEASVGTVGNPDLYPFFSVTLDDLAESRESTSGYWYELEASGYEPVSDSVTVLADGWAHFEYDNSEGSAVVPVGVLFSRDTYRIKGGVTYTVMFEVRNLVAPGSGTTGWTLSCANATDCQAKQGASGFRLDYSEDLADGDTVVYKQFTANNWASTRLWLVALYVGVGVGAVLDCDIRISVYEGVYSGPYKPYVDQSLRDRVRSAETSIEQNSEAIALRATKTEAVQMAQPNLAPLGEADFGSVYNATSNPGGYWRTTPSTWFTQLSDGWVRVYRDNTAGTTDANTTTWRPSPSAQVISGSAYTILVEVRNNRSAAGESAASNADIDAYIQQVNNGQFWGNGTDVSGVGTTVNFKTRGAAFEVRIVKTADTAHMTSPAELFRYNFRADAGCLLDAEFRMSVYAGEYTGPWKPYSGSQLYASKSELKVQSDRIGMVVSNADASSSLQLTADAMSYIGNHVEITDEAGTSTVISGGKIVSDNLKVNAANITGTLAIGQIPDEAKNSNVQVGGRNLVRQLDRRLGRCKNNSDDPYTSEADDGRQHWQSGLIAVQPSAEYTLSTHGWVETASARYVAMHFVTEELTWISRPINIQTGAAYENYSWTVTAPSNAAYARVSAPKGQYESGLKLEKGNRATDWTPAPEDVNPSPNILRSTNQPIGVIAYDGEGLGSWADGEWKESSGNATNGGATVVKIDDPPDTSQLYAFRVWSTTSGNKDAAQTRVPFESASYAFSCWVRLTPGVEQESATAQMRIWGYSSASATGMSALKSTTLALSSTNWVRFRFVFSLTAAQVAHETKPTFILGSKGVGDLQFCGVKIEKNAFVTAWTPSPLDMASPLAVSDALSSAIDYADSVGVEYIVGTQTASTNAWTGATKDSALVAGKSISYKLPYAGTSSAATLDLTLAGGGTTGAKAVQMLYSTSSNTGAFTNVTTHWPVNSVIPMVYDGSKWVVTNYNTNVDTVNRTRWQNVIYAAAAITSGHIICGTSAGYRDVAASVSFDLSYPLLYCATTKSAGGTSDNNFLQINGIKLTNSGTVQGAANYKAVYLKGSVSGDSFTIASSNFLTCTVPSSDDGFVYIPLGMFYNSTTNIYFNSSKELWAYVDGAFRQVTPTDIRASQRIYYRTDLADSELTGPTGAWVTEDGNVYNAWTTKVPPLAASTSESEDKYPFLYTCEQRKRIDGTLACTDVALDENTTVIDGGTIVTNSVYANALNAHDINSSHVLSVGAFTDDDYELISNASVKEDLGKLSEKFADYTDVTGQWIHVDRDAGVILGQTGSGDYQQLTNDRQLFVSSGVVVAYTYKGRFYGKAMEAEEMHIGEFMWVARSNGHFSLKYVGGGS